MKRKQLATDFSVGFVLFVATVVVIASLFLVGDGKSFFADHMEYVVRLPSAGGLKAGSKVSLGGVIAGSVTRIEFPTDLSSSDVLVTLAIEKAYRERIREDSVVWVESQGLLGDALVYVKLGTAAKPLLPGGSTIPYRARAMLDTLAGEEISESTQDLIRTISSILQDVARGQGTLGQLLKNPELYDNLSSFTRSMSALTGQVEGIARELTAILTDLRAQKGALGQLLFSEDSAASISRSVGEAAQLIHSLREVTAQIEAGQGTVGKLVKDAALHDAAKKALDDIAAASARLEGLLVRAEASRSILGRVTTDPQLGERLDALVGRLERSSGSIENILALVESGEGTVGMLVRDPSIAVSLRDVFRGVSESSVVQNVVRNAERDGHEALLRSLSLSQKEREEVLRLRALRRLEIEKEPQGTPVPTSGPELPAP